MPSSQLILCHLLLLLPLIPPSIRVFSNEWTLRMRWPKYWGFSMVFQWMHCANFLEKAMAPYSSILAWKTPRAEEPDRLQSMGSLRVRHNWATSFSLFTFMHWRKKWQPTPVFLPGEPQGWRSLVPVLIIMHFANFQSWPILYNPMDSSPRGCSVLETLLERIQEWVAMLSSTRSSQTRDQTQVSYIISGFSAVWATREAQEYWSG